MKWHWGKPANPGHISFHTGTLLSKAKDEPRMATKQFTTRHLEGLYGVSFGAVFIGVQTFGRSGWSNAAPEPWKPAPRKSRPSQPERTTE